ncbi:MAG: ASKHA domain-containing protein [Promethearchaeota archaeon]
MTTHNKNIVIDFEPISRRIYHSDNETIYHTLTKSGIRIKSLCGGKGTCGKCKLLIQKGLNLFNDSTETELEQLSKNEIKEGWRLACQALLDYRKIEKIKNLQSLHIRIFLPDDLIVEDFKILTTGVDKGIQLNPNVLKLRVHPDKPSLNKPIPDFERILYSLPPNKLKSKKDIEIEYNILKELPDLLRTQEDGLTLTILNNKDIIDCEPGNTLEKNFGIAFDIGTTTIVGYLMNLNDGKIHAVSSLLNPQTAYGEDVITRITYIKENKDGLNQLNSAVINALNTIINKTCKKARIDHSNIYEISIVGNSVMHHIFLGINPTYIGLSPYVPAIQRSLNVKAKNLGLNISRGANVYVLPVVAGFVGADTIGVILSSQIEKESELTLAIDIGTNGEIIIGNKEILATASCAAGSALEGAHILHGMRAAAGAIDTIKIDPRDLTVNYSTIKDKKPMGICGSGIIDAVAELLKARVLTRSGNFNKELTGNDRLIKIGKSFEFIIADKDETSTGKHITISQNDVRELQMAKGAFYSGMRLILSCLDRTRKSHHEIQQIYLAGAFGNYIKKANAKFIGMIPDIPDDKIFQIGNAAGTGAQHCLINKNLRQKAQKLLKKIEYIEIAVEKDFQQEFAKAMYFPHFNLDLFSSLREYDHIPKR